MINWLGILVDIPQFPSNRMGFGLLAGVMGPHGGPIGACALGAGVAAAAVDRWQHRLLIYTATAECE